MWQISKEINAWICIFCVFAPAFEISSDNTNLINPFRVQNTQALKFSLLILPSSL